MTTRKSSNDINGSMLSSNGSINNTNNYDGHEKDHLKQSHKAVSPVKPDIRKSMSAGADSEKLKGIVSDILNDEPSHPASLPQDESQQKSPKSPNAGEAPFSSPREERKTPQRRPSQQELLRQHTEKLVRTTERVLHNDFLSSPRSHHSNITALWSKLSKLGNATPNTCPYRSNSFSVHGSTTSQTADMLREKFMKEKALNENLCVEYEELHREVVDLRSKNSLMTKELSKEKELNEKVCTEYETVYDEVIALRKINVELDNQLTKEKQRTDKFRAECGLLSFELCDTNETNSELQMQIEVLRRNINDLTSELEKWKNLDSHYNRMVSHVQSEIDISNRKIKRTRKRLEKHWRGVLDDSSESSTLSQGSWALSNGSQNGTQNETQNETQHS